MDYEEHYDESHMKPKEMMRYTMHNLAYRIAHNHVDPSHCGYCLHGSGCNRPGRSHYRNKKNWKALRKTQHK